MIKNNLLDISKIILIRSDKILLDLINSELKTNSYRNSLKDFYPNNFRKNYLEYAIKETNNERFNLDYKLDFLEELFELYFKIDSMNIYAYKLEEYSALINKIEPYNIIGYYLANKLRENKINESNILYYIENITSLAFNTDKNYLDYADNHIHLGGSITPITNLLSLFSKKTSSILYEKQIIDELPRIHYFNHINNYKISIGHLVDISKYCISIINTYLIGRSFSSEKEKINILKKFNYITKNKNITALFDIDFLSLNKLKNRYKCHNIKKSNSLLLNEMLKMKLNYKQWLLYNVLVFKLYLKGDFFIKRIIKIFLHSTNILRTYMIMSENIGLSHFSEYSRSFVRKTFSKDRYFDIANNILNSGTTKVEAKITLSSIFNNDYIKYKLFFDKVIIDKNKKNITLNKEKYFLNTNNSNLNYHFCIHFIRESDNHSKIGGIRYFKLRQKLKKEAKLLNKFLYESFNIKTKYEIYEKFYTLLGLDLKILNKYSDELKKEYIDLSKLVTTIDIAGDENKTPPEVFAPIINYLRRDLIKIEEFYFFTKRKMLFGFFPNNKLVLSVHAGEDFNHILTGIRRIDETIEFFNMKENDRIGHALAIGLNPKKWLMNNGDILASKQELLDNLIWIHHVLKYLTSFSHLAVKYILIYEDYILELALYIYGKDIIEGCSIKDLYEAWKIRKYEQLYDNIDHYFEKIPNNCSEKSLHINYKYQFNSKVRERGEEVIRIKYNKNSDSYNEICDEELELLEIVQDFIIEKIAQKKIIIETNPSSNTYISYIKSFEEHPIFRWNPINESDLNKSNKFNKFGVRNSKVKVCINTDDPAIIPTSLKNEFELIKIAAKKYSDNVYLIDEWIENIREEGIKIFNYNHQNYEFIKLKGD